MFNNDVRLRALKTLAETLAPIEQKKAILYFSAGMQRSGQDNQVELRAAINAAVRANVVDLSDRHARPAGGRARRRRAAGQRPRQRAVLRAAACAAVLAARRRRRTRSTSLAADTGGRAFTDTNDFGEAFARVQRDMSAYYLLGYSSTNPAKDGRFRRIQVRVEARRPPRRGARRLLRRPRLRPHRRAAIARRSSRSSCSPPSRRPICPVLVTGGFFRLSADRYYVPISLAVPGSAVPVANGQGPGLARRARPGPRRTGTPGRADPRDAEAAAGHGQDAGRQAGALSVGRHAAAGPLLGEGRRAREHERHDGLVRGADRRARAEAGRDEGQLGRAEHAAAAGRQGQDRQSAGARRRAAPAEPDARRRQGPEAVLLLRGLRSGVRPTARRRSSAPAWRSTAAR